MYPQRGEVIRVQLNPTQGREQMGEARPCLVLSHTAFNQVRNGIVIVCPITGIIKPEVKTLLPIPTGYKITGSIIAEQIRTLDLSQRWWISTGEIMPTALIQQVLTILQVIIA
ncbi:type II toxin-antitoxin system PemK/MazF family toxin [Synechocystis salina LEGE 06155]|nr:type II toxin-antitoxin system PemK/MazF family toxin [Synechocystis salina LEGE 06155]